MTHDIAEGLGLNRITGAVVTRLYDKGPAANAGLKEGDVITHVDGVEVADARAVYYRLTTKGIGQTTRLTAIRKGQPVDVALPLIAAPKPGKDDARNISGNNPLDGARISNILPSIADELGIDETEGVAVTSVRSGSAAQTLGFQPGDIIVAIGDKKIDTVIDAEKAAFRAPEALADLGQARQPRRAAPACRADADPLLGIANSPSSSRPAMPSQFLRGALDGRRGAELCRHASKTFSLHTRA